jgi:hypothetical protein
MPEKPILEKLLVKPGRTFRLVHAPDGYELLLGALPAGVTVVEDTSPAADVTQIFVANRKELEDQLPALKETIRPGDILWVTYLKGSSKTKTDINSDTMHAYARTIGLEGVALVSVNADWSAMRFKLI